MTQINAMAGGFFSPQDAKGTPKLTILLTTKEAQDAAYRLQHQPVSFGPVEAEEIKPEDQLSEIMRTAIDRISLEIVGLFKAAYCLGREDQIKKDETVEVTLDMGFKGFCPECIAKIATFEQEAGKALTEAALLPDSDSLLPRIPACLVSSQDGYACTLVANHKGNHEAHGNSGLIAAWDDAPIYPIAGTSREIGQLSPGAPMTDAEQVEECQRRG
jgi:hypothetical protein